MWPLRMLRPVAPRPNEPPPEIPVVWLTPGDRSAATALALERPGGPAAREGSARPPADDAIELTVSGGVVGVRFAADGRWVSSGPDWDHLRGAQGRGSPAAGRDLLLRSVGRPRPGDLLLDATAGFGRDATALAAAGWSVEAWERSETVAVLLEAALAVGRRDVDAPLRAVLERVTVRRGDVRAALEAGFRGRDRPAVVYLDPMHPPRRGSALVRKDLRALRRLVGPDSDADGLLEASLACAGRRVVVKRPPHAAPLAERPPHRSVGGRRARFDVYDVTGGGRAADGP